jgi:hypothetical protein
MMFTINTKTILVAILPLLATTMTISPYGYSYLISFAQSPSTSGILDTGTQNNNALVCSGVQYCSTPAPIKQNPSSGVPQIPQKSFSSPETNLIHSNPNTPNNNALVCSGVQYCSTPIQIDSGLLASNQIHSNPNTPNNNALVCSGVQYCSTPVSISAANKTSASVSQVNSTLSNEDNNASSNNNQTSVGGQDLQSQSPLQQQQLQQQQQQQPSTSSWLEGLFKFFGGGK